MCDDAEIQEMISRLRAGIEAATAGELCYVAFHLDDMARIDGDLNLYEFARAMIEAGRRATALSDLAAADADYLDQP